MIANINENCLEIKMAHDLTSTWVKDKLEQMRRVMEKDRSYQDVIVNMKDVEFIDSIGISLVIALYRTAGELNKNFKVVGLNQRINNLFQMMRLNEVFSVEP